MPLTPDQKAHYDETKQPGLIAGFVLMLVLSNGVLLVRIGTQFRLAKRLLAEDCLIITATVGMTAILQNNGANPIVDYCRWDSHGLSYRYIAVLLLCLSSADHFPLFSCRLSHDLRIFFEELSMSIANPYGYSLHSCA